MTPPSVADDDSTRAATRAASSQAPLKGRGSESASSGCRQSVLLGREMILSDCMVMTADGDKQPRAGPADSLLSAAPGAAVK
jgi:hypothetical protein